MIDHSTYFPNFIGQEEALRKAAFFIKAYEKTRIFPNTFITGARGFGKTEIAKGIGKNLVSPTNPDRHKQFVEISGAEFSGKKALEQFISHVVTPHINDNQETTLFFDEIHLAAPELRGWLLPVLNPNAANVTVNSYQEQEFTFDFRYFTFLAASTNPEKLSTPLLSRLERIELSPYKYDDLIRILHVYTKGIRFTDNIESEIVKTMRGSPREIVSFARQKLPNFLAMQTDSKTFTPDSWKNYRKTFSIRPLGLLPNELNCLKYLFARQGATLTEIAAKLCLDRSTVQRNVESFLLENGLIRIDGKRYITSDGIKVLDESQKPL